MTVIRLTSPRFQISVTELAAFCCKSGSIETGALGGSALSLQQGQEGPQKVQAGRGPQYKKEVAVSKTIDTEFCQWKLSGRIDGLNNAPFYLVEEIKTTGHTQATLPDAQKNLHFAQAKLYGAIVLEDNQLDDITIQLTYFHWQSEQEFQFEQRFSAQELLEFFNHCLTQYSHWLDQYCQYLHTRNASLLQLEFPFTHYRAGQRSLSVATYRDIRDGNQAIYHAPTGLGKTAALVFPALKALNEDHIQQGWYLTAKNSGQISVQQAVAHLSQQPINIRVLYLKAKEKQCFCSEAMRQGDSPCPYQENYYDRLPQARQAFQAATFFTENEFNQLAQTHQLCPHQLSRDLLPWVDLVVADYNYVFDPYSRLGDHFEQHCKTCTLMVDEAHNLPERARHMFSATLGTNTLKRLREAISHSPIKSQLRTCINKLRNIITENATEEENPLPKNIAALQQPFLETAQQCLEWFGEQNWLLFPQELFEDMMTFTRFSQRLATIENEDRILLSPRYWQIQIICVDPAIRLQQISHQFHSAHYFSGSLLPFDFFCRALQQQAFQSQLILESPFPVQNQLTLCFPLNTRYEHRRASHATISQLINAVWQTQPGRYLITLPSYDYMQQVYEQIQHSPLPVVMQPQSTDPVQREDFLNQIKRVEVLALVIAGGVFAEGLDLAQYKLNGVIIIGTCLPPPSETREQIQQHFQQNNQNGFDFAFRFPGMNRVIQSAGRVIRSETDRGLVLLADDRFCQTQYQQLMPQHWQLKMARSIPQLQQELRAFAQTHV